MNETQRLAYLAHLGIDNYIARRPLKGAAPSVASDTTSLPEPLEIAVKPVLVPPAETPTEKQEQPDALSHLIPQSPPLASLSPNLTETDTSTDSTTNVVSVPDAPVKPQLESIRFALNFWRISDDLLVLDSRETGAALPTDTLLLNIVHSIGYSLERLPQADLLHWPLFSRDQNANDKNQARAMVQAYIQAQVSKQPAKHLFLMGSAAAKFALDECDDWQLVEGQTFQQWQMNLIVIPSLASMLREPLLKRITWQAIKPLS